MVEKQWGHGCCIQREIDIRLSEAWNINRNSGRRMEDIKEAIVGVAN